MAEPIDELELFRRWQAGDAAAGRRFVARHLPAIARFFGSKVPQPHDADDLTARTFEVLVGKLPGFRGESSPRTFLFAIAHNVLLGWVRDKQRADDRFELGSISAIALGPSATTIVHARRQQRLLLDALRALPMDAQVMLELSVFEDMSRAEIAEVTGIPAGTVAHRLRRAKESLAQEIERQAESPALAATTTADLEQWARELRLALAPGNRRWPDLISPAASRNYPGRSLFMPDSHAEPIDCNEVGHAETRPSTDVESEHTRARWQRLRGFVNSRVFGDAAPSIGRYRLLESIGSGGMGVVFSALDTTLQRKVAIKLLTAGRGPQHGHRLQREARAMARLDHPNVVGVYDVGEHEGELFVAMELVIGGTLRTWLAAEPRSWREIVAAFASAARGLAAAHAAGLVHRDFKPENVLVADSGRVCVVDFGLVTRGAASDEAATDIRAVHLQDAAVSVPMLGTPAYMSPEQVLGRPVDARADVWSFSVALFEALNGERPFDRAGVRATLAAIVNGDIRRTSTRRFPRRLDRIVRVGLRADRDERTATMEQIARDLERVLAARRRRWTVFGSVVAATTFAGMSLRALTISPTPCDGIGGAARAAWSSHQRDELAARLVAHGLEEGDIIGRIDAYAQRWVGEMEASCDSDDGSVDALARRVCLESRRHDLAGATSILAEGDEAILRNVDQVLAGLGDPVACADPLSRARRSSARGPTDGSSHGWERDLARARALWNAGDDPRASELARSTFESAAHAEAWWFTADAGALYGEIADIAISDYAPVSPVLERALAAAERSGHSAAAAQLTALLVLDPSHADDDHVREQYARAEALAEASDDIEALAILALHTRRYGASFHGNPDEFEKAEARYAVVSELAREQLGAGHRLTRALDSERHARRKDPRTVQQLRAEVAEAEARWGAASGQAGLARVALAGAIAADNRLDDAILEQTAAAEILAAMHGETAMTHTDALIELFEMHRKNGDIENAVLVADRAIAALDHTGASPRVFRSGPAPVREAVAQMLLEAADVERAIPYAERAVQDFRPYHGLPASLLLAELYVRTGRAREADFIAEEQWTLMQAPDPGIVPVSLQEARIKVVRGEARLALGRLDEARHDLATSRPDLVSTMHRDALRANVGVARIALALDDLVGAESAVVAATEHRGKVQASDPANMDLAKVEKDLAALRSRAP